ncbi:hypothetical protein H4R20_002647, partial [Coemansia guatemalensis]
MYRAVLLPITAYRIQGILILEQEVTGIQAPLLRFVKHAFGVPSTLPSAFWFTRKGGRMMRLQAEVERQAIEMTVRLLSGKGCREAGKLAQWIEAQVQTSLRFPGEMLAYPRLVAAQKLEQGLGRIWWLYIAKILAARGVAITVPERGRRGYDSILAALQPGWAGRGDTRAYRQMWMAGARTISQVFA